MSIKKTKQSCGDKEWRYIPVDDPSAVFATFDLGLSAALLCAGFRIMTVDKANRQKAMFIFHKEDGLEDVMDLYFSDRLEVKGRAYFDHLKALKNMLYSE